MNALSGLELMAWVEKTSAGWKALVEEHPGVLRLPCDIRDTKTVGELLQHIVAVELRYAERLADLPETQYERIGYGSAEEIYATHRQAMGLLRELMERGDYDWEQRIEFATRSAGRVRSSRRTVLVHLLMHSIRHYAQLATLVRKQGIRPGWAMDYMFMDMERV